MFYGWWMCILAVFACTYALGTVYHGFTSLFAPLIKEFGWSYTAISVAASIRGAETSLGDPIAGFLVDRYGARRVVFGGSVLLCIGFLSLSRVNSLPLLYISYIILAFGASGMGNVVFYSLVSQWFIKWRGIALGLAGTGAGIGGLLVPLMVYLLDLMGFRTMFVIFAGASLVVGGILTYFIRSRPQDIGSRPDGQTSIPNYPLKEETSKYSTSAKSYNFKEAMTTSNFWLLTAVLTTSGFAIMMLSTHIMPYLEQVGYPRETAAVVTMAVPLVAAVARPSVGFISDRVSHKVLLGAAVAGQLTAVLLLLFARLSYLLIPFVILLGLSWGGIFLLRPIVLGSYYGTGHIGSLLGTNVALTQAGSIGGPLFAGWVVDITGNYNLALITSAFLLLISIPLVLAMKLGRKIR